MWINLFDDVDQSFGVQGISKNTWKFQIETENSRGISNEPA